LLCIGISAVSRAEEAYIYDSHGKRDPFVTLVGITTLRQAVETLEDITSIEDIILQGIAVGAGGKKIVILNGEMMKEGETIGHLAIKEISKNSITLTIDEAEYKLNIYEGKRGG